MGIATDLNQRERRKFADSLRKMGESATKAAAALEAEDDSTAMVEWLLLALVGSSVNKELGDIFKAAGEAAKASKELDEGPAAIGGKAPDA